MCKHVAATLYGVGVLLDRSPELFFKLRGVDHLELIDSSVSIATGKKDSETLDEGALEDIFGVELADSLEPTAKGKKKVVAKKVTKKSTKKVAKKTAKRAIVKKATVKKAKPAVKTSKKAAKKTTKKVAKKAAKKASTNADRRVGRN